MHPKKCNKIKYDIFCEVEGKRYKLLTFKKKSKAKKSSKGRVKRTKYKKNNTLSIVVSLNP